MMGLRGRSRHWDKDSSPSQGVQFPRGWLKEEGKTPSQLLRGLCGAAFSPPGSSQVSDFQIFPDFPRSDAAFRTWDGAQRTPELCVCPRWALNPLKGGKSLFSPGVFAVSGGFGKEGVKNWFLFTCSTCPNHVNPVFGACLRHPGGAGE